MRQNQYQKHGDVAWWNRLAGNVASLSFELLGKYWGQWSGGISSWGENRIWLEPETGTNTRDRSNFSIHGGSVPGSAGCIDLTNEIPDFIAWFIVYGEDLMLRVSY